MAETFDQSSTPKPMNPIYKRQREDVAKMRTSLLACHDDSAIPTRLAIQKITVLRVYHQVSRIIRYLEIMDKLEDKLYESIDYEIDNADITDSDTWAKLIAIQEKLQRSMIESHKMLQPYLDLTEFSVVDLTQDDGQTAGTDLLMSAETRNNLQIAAQAVLQELMNQDAVPESGDADGTE